ncbi:MAG: PEP-CTERM sorting domain-containing protein [Chthonomonas sp.]|nr:PEP-CTERM sorting domain-containing protein [Chthonomonas sp.]
MKRFCFMISFLGIIFVPSAQALNLVLNPSFEETPILGFGQSDVAADESKMIRLDPATEFYTSSISGVPHWVNGLNSDQASDSGISRILGISPIEGERYAFINNWNRRFSQVLAHTVAVGETYQATVWVGSLVDDARCGRISLVAGDLNPTDADLFAPGSIILSEKTAGTASWTWFQPSVILPGVGWNRVDLIYTVLPGDAAIGKPLMISLLTEAESVGPVQFDAVSVTVVPEPASLAALGLGFVALLSRRARR